MLNLHPSPRPSSHRIAQIVASAPRLCTLLKNLAIGRSIISPVLASYEMKGTDDGTVNVRYSPSYRARISTHLQNKMISSLNCGGKISSHKEKHGQAMGNGAIPRRLGKILAALRSERGLTQAEPPENLVADGLRSRAAAPIAIHKRCACWVPG